MFKLLYVYFSAFCFSFKKTRSSTSLRPVLHTYPKGSAAVENTVSVSQPLPVISKRADVPAVSLYLPAKTYVDTYLEFKDLYK